MDALTCKVRGSPRYELANAAESVVQTLEVFEQEDCSLEVVNHDIPNATQLSGVQPRGDGARLFRPF